MDGDSFMSEKYKAISNLMQMRSLKTVPDAGNSKEALCPKSSELANANIKVIPPNSPSPAIDPS